MKTALTILRSRTRVPFTVVLLALWTLGWGWPALARSQAPPEGEVGERVTALLAEAFPSGVPPQAPGRVLFNAVLDSAAFRHCVVGPFVVYARARDPGVAERLVADAAAGLAPLAGLENLFARVASSGTGVVSGRFHVLVLADSTEEFERLLALLDHCEDLGFSGWKPLNVVWTPENRQAEVVRTWEVQLFNLQHAAIAERAEEWMSHGVGYYTLAHLVNLAVRRGAWGVSPPWFDQGLIDELDIQAYGSAWVGAESWVAETEGWFREGWSGFVPQGMSPPEQPTGPPLELATTVTKTGDSWADREQSKQRHWTELSEDRKSAAPASFAYMAEHQSFLPRDRAYARCALHLLLALDAAGASGAAGAGGPSGAAGAAGPSGAGLLARLDEPASVAPDGMLDAEPLTVLVSAALGGVPAVEQFEALPLSDVLTETQRPEVATRLKELGAEGLLALTDHREQSRWLYSQWQGELAARAEIFRLIMEAECAQQLHEWSLIGQHLDRGMAGALGSRASFPATPSDRAEALEALRAGFLGKKRAASTTPDAGAEAAKKPVKAKSGRKTGEKPTPRQS